MLSQPVAVGGKCRPIRLLSRAVPLYAPTVNVQDSLSYLHTRVCQDTTCDLTFVPSTFAPSLKTVIADVIA